MSVEGPTTFTVDGQPRSFLPWSIEQLEKMDALQGDPSITPGKLTFAIVRLAIENAQPPVEDPAKARVSMADVPRIIDLVNALSGVEVTAGGATVGEAPPKA